MPEPPVTPEPEPRIDATFRKGTVARATFLTGLALVAASIAMAILLDIFGLGPRTLSA